ncbi:hypothetical protein ZIOFF_063414 [Zingiber officinale]|uniref:40S ribosomal protein S25 n=1 Tax=Zingiber officinale TaxID=94328 RepID=A0A8J5KGJ3_ZINOF|nr:hypothetical protein ZIOFF_063414 [Zingiber officinale]
MALFDPNYETRKVASSSSSLARLSSSATNQEQWTISLTKQAPKKDKAPPPSSKPAKSGGGKQKKKKWSKGKQKEKVNNAVLFDQATYDKMLSEVPKYKQITPSVLSERLRVREPRFFGSEFYNIFGQSKLLLLGRLLRIPVHKTETGLICLQINGSLARRAIKDLMTRGAIRIVSAHASQQIYTRATNT